MKFLARVGIGAPVTFLVLSIFSGGVNNAAMVVFCSVVLTFGVALVGWIPLCWVVGWGTLALIGPFVEESDAGKEPDGKEESAGKRLLHAGDDTLTKYMKDAEARGVSRDEVAALLRRQGWPDEEIRKARGMLDS